MKRHGKAVSQGLIGYKEQARENNGYCSSIWMDLGQQGEGPYINRNVEYQGVGAALMSNGQLEKQ